MYTALNGPNMKRLSAPLKRNASETAKMPFLDHF